MIHTFTQSGLGESPFSICHPNDPKARDNTAFFCEHCGTAIKNRFFVKSHDGKVSVVGIDCLKKTGDQGLIDGEKRLRQTLRSEAREAENIVRQAKQDAEDRERFEGKTREEMIAEMRTQIKNFRDSHHDDVYDHKATSLLLSDNRSRFEIEMIDKAIKGEKFSKGMMKVMSEILAKKKSGARKNSKAFNAVLPEMQELVASYQSLVEAHAEKVERIEDQVRDLIMGR